MIPPILIVKKEDRIARLFISRIFGTIYPFRKENNYSRVLTLRVLPLYLEKEKRWSSVNP